MRISPEIRGKFTILIDFTLRTYLTRTDMLREIGGAHQENTALDRRQQLGAVVLDGSEEREDDIVR